MFQIIEQLQSKKKKPKKWNKQRPISDKEYEELIRAIREDADKLNLSDKEVMQRVKSYYGVPRSPDFEKEVRTTRSLVVDFLFVVVFGILFVATISFISSFDTRSDRDHGPILPPNTDDVIYGSTN